MKKSLKSALGVTLLEIMLVLAVASMIIVMSVKYYQSANTSQQANAAVQQISAVAAAMDSLAVGSGSYAAITQATLQSYLGGLPPVTTPSGGVIALTVPPGASNYTLTVPLGATLCTIVSTRITGAANPKVTATACPGGSLTYSYDKTQ